MDHIKVTNQSAFTKSYHNDIEKMVIDDHEDDSKTIFELFINRDGIYDKLPEGLFHQTKGSRQVKTTQDAVKEHKQFKTEEKLARKFFAPIEKMLFQYEVSTELAEREALYDIANGKLNQAYYNFWNLEEDLPEPEANRFLHMLPYAAFIKGNTQATTTALRFILNKELGFTTGFRHEYGSVLHTDSFEDLRLGIDAVLGANHNELLPVWEFTISGIPQSQIHDFVDQAPLGRILQKFTDVFLPIEVEVVYQFETLMPKENETKTSILGYGCSL